MNGAILAAPRVTVDASAVAAQRAPVTERASDHASREPRSTIADSGADAAHGSATGRGSLVGNAEQARATPQPHHLLLGPWLEDHGVPSNATAVTENELTVCERNLQVGRPPQDAIQCDVFTDSRGRIESSYTCATDECLHTGLALTRIYVVRESRLHSVLDVPSGAMLSSEGGITTYISSFLTPADDGLSVEVRVDGTCREAYEYVRADEKELRRSWGMSRLVGIVCAAQGRYVWHRGAFRRKRSGQR